MGETMKVSIQALGAMVAAIVILLVTVAFMLGARTNNAPAYNHSHYSGYKKHYSHSYSHSYGGK